jgi:hypothetical protein
MSTTQNPESQARAVLLSLLPGPDRRRTDSLYQYRLVYRHPDADAEGCLMMWQVTGGRQIYQVALERDDRRQLHWHCTCADAVYRGDKIERHVCKHVRGLAEFAPPVPAELGRAA